MLVGVTNVKYIGEYSLELTFDNRVVKVVDMRETILNNRGPVIEPLKNISVFSKVRVNKRTRTVEWPTGYDCDPSMLFRMGRDVRRY